MDIEQAYKYMSFAQLRDYLKRLRFRQKMWFSIPVFVSVAAILLLSLSGWGTYPQAMSSHKLRFDISSFGIFDWIFTAAMVLFLPYEKTERKFNYSAAVLMAAFTAVKALFGILNPLNLAMAVYYYFAALMLLPINQQINFIKADGEAQGQSLVTDSPLGRLVFEKHYHGPQGTVDCTLGIRPEMLRIDPSGPIEGSVLSSQPAGSESLIQVQVKGQVLLVKCIGLATYNQGETVRLSIDPDFVNVYDTKEGVLIKHSAAALR